MPCAPFASSYEVGCVTSTSDEHGAVRAAFGRGRRRAPDLRSRGTEPTVASLISETERPPPTDRPTERGEDGGLLYAVAAIIDVRLQVAGWAVSSALKTEKLYDGFGSVTFISIALAALAGLGGSGTAKQVVLCGLVLVWALRLGSFLVVRVFKTGGDKRFDRVKSNPGKFAVYWTLQGLWVYVTLLPFLFAISATGGASTAFGIPTRSASLFLRSAWRGEHC